MGNWRATLKLSSSTGSRTKLQERESMKKLVTLEPLPKSLAPEPLRKVLALEPVRETAIWYVRCSTDQQVDGDSLDRQRRIVRRYCDRMNYDLKEDLSITDEGKSAYKADNIKTGGLGRLLKEMQAGKIRAKHVIVEDIDRLNRQGFDPAYMMLKEFVAAGVIIDIVDKTIIGPDFTHDPMTIMGIVFSSTNAHQESHKKSKRCGAAWDEKRKLARTKRIPLTRQVPSWCKAIKDKDGNVKIVLIPERVKALRRMFELAGKYNLGSLLTIRKLKAEGYRPFGKADWNQDFVQNTLKNRAVLGEYQPYKGDCKNRVPIGEVIPNYYPNEWKGGL
jgi:DNA invertase Pin-like site-specific DNA recombinase